MRVNNSLALLFGWLLLLAGCDQQQAKPPKLELALVGDGPMQVISLAQLPQVRQQFQGDVLVIDLWASWCVSCIERFPAMVAMSEQYQHQPVQFISLNMDEPSDGEALTWSNNFLKKMQAKFPHYHLRENLMQSFEALNLLGIPVVLIYDQDGTERFRLTGDNPNKQFGDDDVDQAIRTLLP